MRGTPAVAGPIGRPRRFIPAYAGNASLQRSRAGGRSVHPRVCGERTPVPARRNSFDGSSPRMRGTRAGAPHVDHRIRFIPAYAGNAIHVASETVAGPVHPRVCGERWGRDGTELTGCGSSPRMRGTRIFGAFRSAFIRFIPAYAGNAKAQEEAHGRLPVHPRVCGERSCAITPSVIANGSSPRMRGTHAGHRRSGRHNRFIPAYAGNALPRRSKSETCSVHPRVCGERPRSGVTCRIQCGSSPRMRGTLIPDILDPSSKRFIPAYAGNASNPEKINQRLTVHPRVCGERFCSSMDFLNRCGSSPRMRGTLL